MLHSQSGMTYEFTTPAAAKLNGTGDMKAFRIPFHRERTTTFGVFPQDSSRISLPGLRDFIEEVTIPFATEYNNSYPHHLSRTYNEFMMEQSQLARRDNGQLVKVSVYGFQKNHQGKWKLYSIDDREFELHMRLRLFSLLAFHLKTVDITIFDLQNQADLRYLTEFRKRLGGPLSLRRIHRKTSHSRLLGPAAGDSGNPTLRDVLTPEKKIIVVAEATVAKEALAS